MIRPTTCVIAILIGSMLFGCGTPSQTYTNEDFKQATKYCYDQAYTNQNDKVPNWFTRYLDCSREHVMPIEVSAYGREKEVEVKRIYDEMYKIAPLVDKREMTVQSAYGRWDQMKAEMLNTKCALKIEQSDGGDHCLMVESIKKY